MISLEDLPFEDLYIREAPDFPAICKMKVAYGSSEPVTQFVPELFRDRIAALREILLRLPTDHVDFRTDFDNFGLRVCQTYNYDGARMFSMRRLSKDVPLRDGITTDPGIMEEIRSWSDRRGLILIIGETGSGKTTSAIGAIHSECLEQGGVTATAEDPIEYKLPACGTAANGAAFLNMQWPVENPSQWGSTMGNAMRNRPDRILVGEARTPETITQLLQISLSGARVYCTTHGDSPILGIQRLMDIGRSGPLGDSVNSAMADALVAVMHQRRDRGKMEIELLTTSRKPGTIDQCKQMIRSNQLPQLANQIEQQKNRRIVAFKR